MCRCCGSFGQGVEGHLIPCSQCGQCYHPYCVNVKVRDIFICYLVIFQLQLYRNLWSLLFSLKLEKLSKCTLFTLFSIAPCVILMQTLACPFVSIFVTIFTRKDEEFKSWRRSFGMCQFEEIFRYLFLSFCYEYKFILY